MRRRKAAAKKALEKAAGKKRGPLKTGKKA
jgi:hypothetical protein